MSEFQKGATYERIKDYVKEQTGYKVLSLYIAQVKAKHGLEMRENINLPKSEVARQPICPPEKEKAIVNEVEIDVTGLSIDEVKEKAIEMIDNSESQLDYQYTKPEKELFYSWVFANGLR